MLDVSDRTLQYSRLGQFRLGGVGYQNLMKLGDPGVDGRSVPLLNGVVR